MTTPETDSTRAAPLTLTLFGPMQVQVQGQPLPHLRSRKALWLLALLALRGGRPVEREWLAGALWPDTDQDRAFDNLRPALSELRKALGAEGARLQSPSRHAVGLDLAGADVDTLAFDAAVADGRPAALARAVELYRGPLLEGCAEEWVGQERGARERECLDALQALGDGALAAGDDAGAAGWYRRAAALDPWREAARRGLMEALARGGDSNAALQVYRELVDLLRGDPAATPDEETSALYARLRAAARRRAAAPAPDAAPPAVSGHLPHALTELVGREDERLEVTARLARSRLVTLTGPGGIGKTRLASEVAREAAAGYADGAWFVGLEALTDGAAVAGQIAAVLGVRETAGRSRLEGLAAHLRGRRLLLVLDNCEHLRDACAEAAAHLLRECAGLRVLATSREALGVTGEAAWAVPPLAVPVPEHLPAGQATLLRVLMGYEGVRLFVERAQAVQKTFALTASNARVVAQVCARLEGIPLALELGAARLRAMTVAQIAARLDDHLSLLTAGSRAAPSRQQTLRATLDWSYALLGAAEKAVLARLSVFAGGWTLEAAEEVCAGGEVAAGQMADLLTSLVDKSLAAFEDRDGAPGGRCRLPEVVRQYAAGCLGAEADGVRARHRDYFLRLAEEAEPLLTGAEQEAPLARLEAEQENLRAALAASGPAEALRLTAALWQFWELRGRYAEGRAALAAALARPPAEDRSAARAKALNGAGVLAVCQGDHPAARALYAESLDISRALGDPPGIAWSLYDLGNVCAALGDGAAARALYDEALAIFRELGHQRGIGGTLHRVGLLVSDSGDPARARALYEESLAISRALGDRQGMAWSLNDLGGLARDAGDYAGADAFHAESLSISEALGDRSGAAWSLHHLANAAAARGDHAAARAPHAESLALFRELGNRTGVAWALCDQAGSAAAEGEPALARAQYAESIGLLAALGDRRGAAVCLGRLAAAVAPDDPARAARLWGAAAALHESVGAPAPGPELADLQEAVRQALGADAFAAAWAAGRALTLDQAVAAAQGTAGAPGPR